MISSRIANVLIGHHVTEKSTILRAESNQYVFRVVKDADKREIKEAVEKMFGVKVDSVRVLNVKGKWKRFGHMYGRRKDWKKAYVRVADGATIEMLEGD